MRLHSVTEAAQVLHASAVDGEHVLVLTDKTAALWNVEQHDIVVEASYHLPQRAQLVLAHDYHHQTSVLFVDQAQNLCFLQLETGHNSQHAIEQPESCISAGMCASAVSRCVSNTIFTEGGFSCVHAAVSVYQGWVHVVSTYEWHDPNRRRVFISKHQLQNETSHERPAGT